MKTYSQKVKDVQRTWYNIDATDLPFGRIATTAAGLLIGKSKATFTPHTDGGDYVVIINAANMKKTGNKQTGKLYYRYSGFPCGLKTQKINDIGNKVALEKAIKGMLPPNRLRSARLARLKIYDGPEHNHNAQKPEEIDVRGIK